MPAHVMAQAHVAATAIDHSAAVLTVPPNTTVKAFHGGCMPPVPLAFQVFRSKTGLLQLVLSVGSEKPWGPRFRFCARKQTIQAYHHTPGVIGGATRRFFEVIVSLGCTARTWRQKRRVVTIDRSIFNKFIDFMFMDAHT